MCYIFFFKQKTAYEMRISDWSSDVCSSDLQLAEGVIQIRRIVGAACRLLPCVARILKRELAEHAFAGLHAHVLRMQADRAQEAHVAQQRIAELADVDLGGATAKTGDRKSTRLNSSH